ncbi:MAG: CDP-alcohol phosphatidyltransferase family protein [Gemmatimonadota bacterium]
MVSGVEAPVVSGAEATSTRRSSLVNVPNVLSALRLPIAAAFVAVDGLLWRGALLSLGALTDALDGWLARQFGQESKTGALLDPLFDKVFVLVALGAFVPGPYLGWPEFLILVSRDLYVVVVFLAAKLLRLAIPARARTSGKVVTFLQMATLFGLLLVPDLTSFFVVVVGLASAAAIADYTAVGLASVRQGSRAA